MTSAGTSAGTDAGTEGRAGASLLPPTKPGPCRALPPTPDGGVSGERAPTGAGLTPRER